MATTSYHLGHHIDAVAKALPNQDVSQDVKRAIASLPTSIKTRILF